MKKLAAICLIVACLLTLVSCDDSHTTTTTSASTQTTTTTSASTQTTTTEQPVVLPEYEKITRVLTKENEDGVKLELTFHSYRLIGAEYADERYASYIYGKSNEFMQIDVKVTNGSDSPIHQWLPTYCRESAPPSHNHELTYSFADAKGNKMQQSYFGYGCPTMIDKWTLAVGESAEFTLKLAAGEIISLSKGDVHYLYGSEGLRFYDESVYENGSNVFTGKIAFAYNLNNEYPNDHSVAIDAELMLLYEEAAPLKFGAETAEKRTFTWTNVDANQIAITVKSHGYYDTKTQKPFYRHDEYIDIDVIIENRSEETIWYAGYGNDNSYEHPALKFTFGDGDKLHLDQSEHFLTSGVICIPIPAVDARYAIAPGESRTFRLKLAAGEPTAGDDFDLAAAEGIGGIKLYDDIYTQGSGMYDTLYSHIFSGKISFLYQFDPERAYTSTVSTTTISFLIADTTRSDVKIPLNPDCTEMPSTTDTTILETTTDTTTTPPIAFTEKPVIYLYPEKETKVTVKLDYKGKLLCTYPPYNDLWHILAHPDGTLTNLADGKEYSYLFWDGIDDAEYDLSRGYCVKGEDTADFLRKILSEMGLTPREANEFIVYWLPRMQQNPYNLITFQKEAYTEIAPLAITPKPDSMLRVFMVYQPLSEAVEIEAPEIESFEREGFTVVEWGGREIN